MLSNILKNNLIGSILLMLLLAGAGFTAVFAKSVFTFPKEAAGVLYASANEYNDSRMLLLVLGLLCLFGGAILCNYMLSTNETLTKPTFFAAFLFVLLNSEEFSSYTFHPALAGNILILLGMMRMMHGYRVDDAKALFFDGAFFFSSAILIYFPSVTLLPMVFVSLILLRPFVWREWVMAFLGILAPHLLTASVMYILGRLDRYYNQSMFSGFSYRSFQPDYGSQYFVLFCIGFLFLLVLFNRVSGVASRKIRQQKNISILWIWLVLGIGGVFYETPFKTSIPPLCIPPIAGLLGEWLGNFKRSTLSDFALLLLLSAFSLSVLQIKGVL